MPAHRKPAELHRLDGTYRADRHTTADATPIDPTPPKGLHKDHLAAWAEIVEAGGEYLAQADRMAVELAAVLTVRVRSGSSTAADAAQLVNLLSKLGCTPAGRRGLDKVRPPEPEDVNAFDEFFTPQR